MRHGTIGQVYGRVQGVGFRYFVRTNALAHKLDGWAVNQDDGSVEVCLIGVEEQIENMQKVVEVGPDASNVTKVTWRPHFERLDQIHGFSIG